MGQNTVYYPRIKNEEIIYNITLRSVMFTKMKYIIELKGSKTSKNPISCTITSVPTKASTTSKNLTSAQHQCNYQMFYNI